MVNLYYTHCLYSFKNKYIYILQIHVWISVSLQSCWCSKRAPCLHAGSGDQDPPAGKRLELLIRVKAKRGQSLIRLGLDRVCLRWLCAGGGPAFL